MKANIVAQRLKKLRKKAGYTQEELAIELYKKQKVSITTATIKKYETSNPNKLNQICGMRIEFLNAFADFYGVPTDYILGKINSTSTSLKEQVIYENFGLNGGALLNLKLLNNIKGKELEQVFGDVPPILVLNALLKDQITKDFILHLFQHYINKEKCIQDMSSHHPSEIELERLKYSYKDKDRYFAINRIETFIDEFYDRFIEYRQARKISKTPEFQELLKSPEIQKNRRKAEKNIKKLRKEFTYDNKIK